MCNLACTAISNHQVVPSQDLLDNQQTVIHSMMTSFLHHCILGAVLYLTILYFLHCTTTCTTHVPTDDDDDERDDDEMNDLKASCYATFHGL